MRREEKKGPQSQRRWAKPHSAMPYEGPTLILFFPPAQPKLYEPSSHEKPHGLDPSLFFISLSTNLEAYDLTCMRSGPLRPTWEEFHTSLPFHRVQGIQQGPSLSAQVPRTKEPAHAGLILSSFLPVRARAQQPWRLGLKLAFPRPECLHLGPSRAEPLGPRHLTPAAAPPMHSSTVAPIPRFHTSAALTELKFQAQSSKIKRRKRSNFSYLGAAGEKNTTTRDDYLQGQEKKKAKGQGIHFLWLLPS